jgi:hypothetical protein
MKTNIVVLGALVLVSCGGRVLELNGGSDSGPSSATSSSGESSSGASTSTSSGGIPSGISSSGSPSGSSTSSGGSTSSGSSGAPAVCVGPPPKNSDGGRCTLCNGEWYCPIPGNQGFPPCPSDLQLYGPCSGQYTNGCIACAPDGSVRYWYCDMGEFVNGTDFGFTCH